MHENIRRIVKWGIVFGTQATTTPTTTAIPAIVSEATKPKTKLNFKEFPFTPFTAQPIEIFAKLHAQCENVYLLESIEGPRKLTQYSFIGFDPTLIVKVKNGEVTIHNKKTGEEIKQRAENPLQVIQQILKSRAVVSNQFRLTGGAVGYFSYETVRYWEKLPTTAYDDLDFPDAEFGIFEDGIVFDHKKKRTHYYYLTENRLPKITESLKQAENLNPLVYQQPKTNIEKDSFEKAVEKAKEYITHGDIFQVVLSKRYEFPIQGSLIHFYRALRQINPSPYMYFLKMSKRQIVGASPEMLVRVDNRVAETFPIAGTRPCTQNAHKNRHLAKELLADPKERAEHVMLVDLARNDLGKISEYGSVKVTEFMKVHRYSHVQHIVSRVEGKLKEAAECYDALSAVFPAGTVSGAPKPRAMEIIEELEPTRRGPYAGAVGYFSTNGNADFAITIRTLFANKDRAYIQVGAGIVADSIPEKEWFETEHKAEALMKALKACGEKTA